MYGSKLFLLKDNAVALAAYTARIGQQAEMKCSALIIEGKYPA